MSSARNAKRKSARKAQRRESNLRRKKDSDVEDLSNNIVIHENERVKLHNSILQEMKSYDIYFCNMCNERNFLGDLSKGQICFKCTSYVSKKNEYPPWSEACCPIGDLPEELKNLSTLEKLMISLSFLEAYIVKLGFQGQRVTDNEVCARGLRKNTIAFPMDLNNLQRAEKVMSLPWSPAHLVEEDRIRVIVYKGNDVLTHEEESKLRKMYKQELTVRRLHVLKALQWKKTHCHLYNNIEIDEDLINTLPENEVHWIAIREESENPEMDNVQDNDEDLSSAFMDVPVGQERNIDLWRQIGQALKYSVGCRPVSEFNWKEYFYKAFPVLFPLGIELDAFMKLEDAIRHLLLHKESRFREDCRFYFVAFSQLRRRNIIKGSKIQCSNVSIQVLRFFCILTH